MHSAIRFVGHEVVECANGHITVLRKLLFVHTLGCAGVCKCHLNCSVLTTRCFCCFCFVVFAMLGMLSPASRGALMTAGIFLFMFMGWDCRVLCLSSRQWCIHRHFLDGCASQCINTDWASHNHTTSITVPTLSSILWLRLPFSTWPGSIMPLEWESWRASIDVNSDWLIFLCFVQCFFPAFRSASFCVSKRN